MGILPTAVAIAAAVGAQRGRKTKIAKKGNKLLKIGLENCSLGLGTLGSGALDPGSLGSRDVGFQDLGSRDLGLQDLGSEDLGLWDLGSWDLESRLIGLLGLRRGTHHPFVENP